ncbi:MAG: choice-of-anchor D domain-containing protein [Candidatus Poribacteria bacterium]|nr:choice-of-anchor D domain-containing protein [Candidatus Poribacteria bacterium]
MKGQTAIYLLLYISCFFTSQIAQANDNPIFVVVGNVTDANGARAADNLIVTATNETKSIKREAKLGVNTAAGSYIVPFIALNENPIVAAGDALKVTVKTLRGSVLGERSHTVTETEIGQARVVIDIQLQEPTIPEEPTASAADETENPVFVVLGNVTDVNGASAANGLVVTVTNETRALVQETQIGTDTAGGSYVASFVALDETPVVAAGDTLSVRVRGTEGILGEASQVVTEAEIRQSKTVIDIQLQDSTPPTPLSITLDKAGLDFGIVEITQSRNETLTITNPNAVELVISSIASSRSDFLAAPSTLTLAPGDSQTVTVTFQPSTEGNISGTLTITSNAGVETITLSGFGETPEPTFGALTAISFADVPSLMIAGGTFQFRLIGSDAAGLTQAVAGSDAVWEVTGGLGTIDVAGKLTVTTVGTGTVKTTLKSNAALMVETAAITVSAAPPENIRVEVAPDQLTAGSAETATVTITVTDEFDNPAIGQTITLTATEGGIDATATEVGGGVYSASYTAGAIVGDVEIHAAAPNGKTGEAALTLSAPDEPPSQTATFELTARDVEVTVDRGDQTARYRIRLDGENGFSDTIELFASELPPSTTADIDPKTITLSETEPIDIADVTLTLLPDIPAGDYPFTVLALSEGGVSQRLTLRLKVEAVEQISTRVTLNVQPATVSLMGMLNLLGELVPLEDTPVELSGIPIQIIFTGPSGRTHPFETVTGLEGSYKLPTPFSPDEVGEWDVEVRFNGNDLLKASERERSFSVTKGIASIVFDGGTIGALGMEREVIGRLQLGEQPQAAPLQGERLTLRILRPDGAASTLTDITTESLGIFRHTLKLTLPGEWRITATWAGNEAYESAMETFVISVSQEIGKAIIVLGGGNRQDNPAWMRFNGLAAYVHNVLIKRQFNDQDDIQFLSPDPNETEGADNVTSLTTLDFAITNWAQSQVNPQVPLLLYLLSHNLEDQFLLEKRGNSETFLSPDILDEWLDSLPEGTPVTIIIEACHSGNFINQPSGAPTPLVGPNRTIIVSARGDKQAKILRNHSSFSKTFFDQIDANKPVAEAFRAAEEFMRRTPLHRDQFPQMDADGNGLVNEAQDFAAVANRYLPADIVSLADPPEFIDLTESQTLAEGISSLRIETELLGVGITRVFATVIPPDFDPTQRIDDWEALAFDEFDLALVSEGKYGAAYASFTIPGDYTVIVNAVNPDGSAEPVQTTITVPGEQPTGGTVDVNGDGRVDVLDLVTVASQFGQRGDNLNGDVNGDGRVDVLDLILVGSRFGESTVSGAPSIGVRSPREKLKLSLQGASYEQILQALTVLEAMPNPPHGAIITRDFLRAWLSQVTPAVTETRLFPNYPNPFNPETWMPYQLSADATVAIDIYDTRGTLVRQLNLGRQPAGYYMDGVHAAYWDGRSEAGELVSSGLYFYRFRAGAFTEVRPLVVLK